MDEQKKEEYHLDVSVRNPEELLFQGEASSVTTYNEKGLFDVLPIHENFISIIKDKVIVRGKAGEREFPVVKGVIKVEENAVDVFLGEDK
jgi:F0F1-type ATP synthase epsilon subunit